MKDVSVIIINYNTTALTLKAVSSIVHYTEGCTYEIIVVDNDSSESITQLQDLGPQIKLIKSDQNLGFAGGNNLGIKHASGQYILLMNSDAMLKNNAICLLHEKLKQNTRIGAISARLEFPDGKLQYVCQRFPSIRYQLVELFRLQMLMNTAQRGRTLYGAFFDHKSYAEPDWVWATFFMFPRELLSKMPDGVLPETFFMYYEDVEWCWHIRKAGFIIAYEPQAQVIHDMNLEAGARKKWMLKNEADFLRIYYHPMAVGLIKVLARLLKFRLRS